MLRVLIISFLCFFILPQPRGEDIKHIKNNHTRFRHLTIRDGLPNNAITCFQQDNDGYIWIGTRQGLVRYDGHTFKQCDTILSKSYITDLGVDDKQNLWVATKNGLFKLDHQDHSWVKTPLLINDSKGLSHSHVRAILPDSYPHIWVETLDGNLHYLNTKDFSTQLYSHDRITQEYYDYHTIYKDKRSKIWLGGRNLGPLHLDSNNNFIYTETDPFDRTKKRDKDVACIFEDSDANFWISATDGFYLYKRKNDSVEKYLVTSTFDIKEDKHGILWLATGNGLKSFNREEKTFTSYLHHESDAHSLIDNHATCVMIDRDENIWVGTKEGISILTDPSNSIKHFRHLPNQQNSISNNEVSCFFQSNDTSLWIGTDGGGLNRLNLNDFTFQHFKPNRSSNSIASNRVKTITGTESDLWIGLWQGVGFNKYNISENRFTKYALRPNSRKADWYNDLWLQNDSTLWCGIWGSLGIHQFNISEQRFEQRNFRPANEPANNPIYKQVKNGKLTLYFGNRGIVYIYDSSNKNFRAFISNKLNSTHHHLRIESANIPVFRNVYDVLTIGSNTVVACDGGLFSYNSESEKFKILSDKHSYHSLSTEPEHITHLWLASEMGIEFMDLKNNQLLLIENMKTIHYPNQGEPIKDIYFCNNNTLLCATNSSLLSYNTSFNKFEELAFNLDSIINQYPIKSIEQHGDNLILILKRGFIVYSSNKSSYTYYSLSTHNSVGMFTDIIYDISSGASENEIILATDRGLLTFNTIDQSFKSNKDTQAYTIYDCEFTQHKINMCTNQGIVNYDINTNKLVLNNQPQDDALSSHLVSFIYPHKDNIWVGTTNKGINQINLKTNRVKHYFGSNFKGKDALCMHITSSGKFYIGGDRINEYNVSEDKMQEASFEPHIDDLPVLGINETSDGSLWLISANQLYRVNNNKVTKIANSHNIENIEFTGANHIDTNSNLWLGTKQGLLQLDPAKICNSTPKDIRMTCLTIMGEDSLINSATKDFTLPYYSNFINFSFSAMNFAGINQNYEYQLAGVDKNWQTTNTHACNYTNLSPGNYEFRVRLKNMPELSTNFLFKIKPPFWKSWWFIGIIIVISLLSIIQWWRLRIKRLSIIENNLNLRQKLLLSQMNPHFIFNALIAIQNFIFQNDPSTAGSYLSKFAKLMRLYLNNMRYDTVSLAKEIETLSFYLDMQQLRFNNNFRYTIETYNISSSEAVKLPSMMLQPLVENAVEHGVSQLKDGLINITIRKESDHLLIDIMDNGKLSVQKKDGEKHCSVSTQIIKDRISNFNKTDKGTYFFKLEKYKEGMREGTVAKLKLPMYRLQ